MPALDQDLVTMFEVQERSLNDRKSPRHHGAKIRRAYFAQLSDPSLRPAGRGRDRIGRHSSFRLNRDGWSFQDALVKRFQAKKIVIILFRPGLPREVHVRHLARNYRQFTLEFWIQEVTDYSTLRDRVYFHCQSAEYLGLLLIDPERDIGRLLRAPVPGAVLVPGERVVQE